MSDNAPVWVSELVGHSIEKMVSPFRVKGSHKLLEYVHSRGVLQWELALQLHNGLSADIYLLHEEGSKIEVIKSRWDNRYSCHFRASRDSILQHIYGYQIAIKCMIDNCKRLHRV